MIRFPAVWNALRNGIVASVLNPRAVQANTLRPAKATASSPCKATETLCFVWGGRCINGNACNGRCNQ